VESARGGVVADFGTLAPEHRNVVRMTFLGSQRLAVETDPGQDVVVYSTQPGSPSETALLILAETALHG
jgi:hypothetical protein